MQAQVADATLQCMLVPPAPSLASLASASVRRSTWSNVHLGSTNWPAAPTPRPANRPPGVARPDSQPWRPPSRAQGQHSLTVYLDRATIYLAGCLQTAYLVRRRDSLAKPHPRPIPTASHVDGEATVPIQPWNPSAGLKLVLGFSGMLSASLTGVPRGSAVLPTHEAQLKIPPAQASHLEVLALT